MQFLFPNEILQLILNFLSTRDLFQLKLVNRQFRQVIKQIELGQLSQIQLSFADDYRQQFYHICKSANYLLFNHYLDIFKDNKSGDFWRQFLCSSCLSGDYRIPNYLIKKYQKLEKTSQYDTSVATNHYNLNIILEKNDPFVKACQGGNIELVKKIIKLYYNHNHTDIDDWNYGLYGACLGGRMEIAKLMIEKLERSSISPNLQNKPDWNWGLAGACQGGHIEIVKFMIEKGAFYCDNCHRSISEH